MRRILLAGLMFIAATAHAADERFVNERFGIRFSVPSDVFEQSRRSSTEDGQTFITADGRARIVVYGAENTEKFSLAEYRRTLLAEFPGYDDRSYDPGGRTWFVLSGFKGNDIYYQKVMFSCGERRISVLSITFPRDEKPFYSPLVERIEDSFRPATCG